MILNYNYPSSLLRNNAANRLCNYIFTEKSGIYKISILAGVKTLRPPVNCLNKYTHTGLNITVITKIMTTAQLVNCPAFLRCFCEDGET